MSLLRHLCPTPVMGAIIAQRQTEQELSNILQNNCPVIFKPSGVEVKARWSVLDGRRLERWNPDGRSGHLWGGLHPIYLQLHQTAGLGTNLEKIECGVLT